MTTPADEILLGLNEFTEQPIEVVHQQGEPDHIVRTFIGPRSMAADQEATLLSTYPVLSLNSVRSAPTIIKIETSEAVTGLGGGISPIDPDTLALSQVVWTLDWERDMRDVRSHPWFDTSGVSVSVIEKIDAAIKKGIASVTDWDAAYSVTHMNDYRDTRLRGITQYIAYAPVLRAQVSLTYFSKLHVPAIGEGKVIPWSSINIPFPGGDAYTPVKALIDQPTIHVFGGYVHPTPGISAGAWGDAPVNEWLVNPLKRGYTRNPPKYDFTFEWLGATTYDQHLYDGGSG